jgi:carbamate kinase
MMLVVIALGGNALLRRGEPPDIELQRQHLAAACQAIAHVANAYDIVITHGNGPQVGYLALQPGAYPLDVLGAETQGMIGYLIDQGLSRVLPERDIATLLTQTMVDANDPAFQKPTKPIGPVYSPSEAERLITDRGWEFKTDGDMRRRVVASPEPLDILELRTIRFLVESKFIVVAAGGGGIPVVADRSGGVHGVEAVVDKDLAAALLARRLGAEALLLLTDVSAVYQDWGTPEQRPIRVTSPAKLRQQHFESGSMGPKVEAACRFVENGGVFAGIGSLTDAVSILSGEVGTIVRSE